MSERTAPEDRWIESLMCHVLSLGYDFRTRTGQLFMADGVCCDMGGCLALFRRIDPGVTVVDTYAGRRRDTGYRKMGGEWRAFDPAPEPEGDRS